MVDGEVVAVELIGAESGVAGQRPGLDHCGVAGGVEVVADLA
jgi:hypothetical protein